MRLTNLTFYNKVPAPCCCDIFRFSKVASEQDIRNPDRGTRRCNLQRSHSGNDCPPRHARGQSPGSSAANQTGVSNGEGKKIPFQRWNAATILAPSKPDSVRTVLQEVKELARPDLITKLYASRPLCQEPQDQGKAIFSLEVGLRSDDADRLYSKLKCLANRIVWSFVCAQI